MQQEFNPYRPPEAPVVDRGTGEDADGVAVWRDGNAVVAVRDRAFPPRCVKCNAPVQKQEMHARSFYWHTPWLYLLILLNILIYAIVAMAVRKKTRHDVALCAQHLRRRRIFIAIGWSWPLAIFIAAEETLRGDASGAGQDLTGMDAVLAKSLEEFDLSVRTANCLKNANIQTVRELVSKSEREILEIKNFGKKSLEELQELLERLGLSFGMTGSAGAPGAGGSSSAGFGA